MKSTKANRFIAGRVSGRSFLSVASLVVLSGFVVAPVFAQRGEGSRDNRSEGSRVRSEVRVDQQRGSRDGNRGSAPQVNSGSRSAAPQARDNNRGSVSRDDVRSANSGRIAGSRDNVPQYRDNRRYEPRYDRFYGRWPARGTTVRVIPQGGVWRVHNGVRYAYRNGFYYRPYGSSYVVVAPPFGFRISSLPVGFVAFTLANAAYYYYAGTYYQRYNNEYVVVQPPLGSLVQSIPEGGQQVVIDGNTFYIVDGIQYQAVMYNGSIWYKVIKIENRVDSYNGENPY